MLSPFGERNLKLYNPKTLVITGIPIHFHLIGSRIQDIIIRLDSEIYRVGVIGTVYETWMIRWQEFLKFS